ncbi:MAG: sigma-70 family RNA polymerase sigma factor, partial [Acidimicrobiia bacterium]
PALHLDALDIEDTWRRWQVRQAIAQLPPDEAEIVRLQHLDGYTHSEIADRLSMPVGTVKSRSFRAHKRLVQLLGHVQEVPA